MQIVNVRIIFSVNKKIGSKFIRWLTNHNIPNYPSISHTALLINKRVFESTIKGGVRIISLENWLKEGNEIKACVSLGEYYLSPLIDHLRSLKGKKYDYLGVIYLGLHFLWKKIISFHKLPRYNPWHNENKYFCSEVLEFVLKQDLSTHSPNCILSEFYYENKVQTIK